MFNSFVTRILCIAILLCFGYPRISLSDEWVFYLDDEHFPHYSNWGIPDKYRDEAKLFQGFGEIEPVSISENIPPPPLPVNHQASDPFVIIPGQNPPVNIHTTSTIESTIDGDFEGWTGETIIKLINGQTWKQSEYYYEYYYAYMPNILIYMDSGEYKMKVEGLDKPVGVIQIR